MPGAVDPDGAPLYPGLHKALARGGDRRRACDNGERFALRLDMQRARRLARERLGGAPLTFTELDEDGRPQVLNAQPEHWGDAVILRKDVPASYHLAVVVDDARQGVTHVTRGRDLFPATGLHRLLQVLLGLPEPLYQHHRLLTDARRPQAVQERRRHRAWRSCAPAAPPRPTCAACSASSCDAHAPLGLAQRVLRSEDVAGSAKPRVLRGLFRFG